MFTLREQQLIMNDPTRHQNEQVDLQLLELALTALKRTTGIAGRITALEPDLGPGCPRPDAAIELDAGGELRRYTVEIKRIDRFAAIGQVKQQLDRCPGPGLLVAPRITAATAHNCRVLDVQFIDANGNAFLRGPGLFVWVEGQHDTVGAIKPTPRGGTPATLKAIFALLCRPKLVNAPYRELKDAAGIALGAVTDVFNDLAARAYLAGGKAKEGRRIVERQRLIEEWVTTYPIKLRPKLKPQRFHAPAPDWWQATDITRYNAQWGGEVAADKLTGQLKPNAVTIYMRPENARRNLTNLVVDHRLRADPNGEIEVLETFWGFPPDNERLDVVPPLLVYADLLATMDPRNHETARMIHEEKLLGPDAKG